MFFFTLLMRRTCWYLGGLLSVYFHRVKELRRHVNCELCTTDMIHQHLSARDSLMDFWFSMTPLHHYYSNASTQHARVIKSNSPFLLRWKHIMQITGLNLYITIHITSHMIKRDTQIGPAVCVHLCFHHIKKCMAASILVLLLCKLPFGWEKSCLKDKIPHIPTWVHFGIC